MSVCATCCVRLEDADALREHYHSDLHAVNLKRRVAELPPVSQTDLDRHKAAEAEARARKAAAAAPCVYLCDACGKTFGAETQLDMHVKSKKHILRVKEIIAEQKRAAADAKAAAAAGIAVDGVAESKEDGGPPAGSADDDAHTHTEEAEELTVSSLNCLFCFQASEDIAANLQHMRLKHSFFVPDLEYLSNPEGLVEHLMEKVVAGKCLFCHSAKVYETPQAAQQHMIDKMHCKIRYETDEDLDEYAEFYDYSADNDSDIDEDDDDDDVPADGRIIISTPGGDAYRTEAGDLELPSGAIARHRLYARMYKQYWRSSDRHLPSRMQTLMLEYKASGMPTSSALAIARQATLGIGARGNRVDERGQRAAARHQKHMDLHTGLQTNWIIRKYFRIQMRQ